MKLNEVRILTNMRLSETQKIVLARVLSAPNPHVAYDNINEGENLVTSAEELAKLGLLSIGGGEAEVTEQGTSVLQNENIVDESGQLTQDGQKYAQMRGPSEKGTDAQPPQPTATEPGAGGDMGGEEDMGMGGEEDMGMDDDLDPEMQSFDLLKSLADEITLAEQMARLSKND